MSHCVLGIKEDEQSSVSHSSPRDTRAKERRGKIVSMMQVSVECCLLSVLVLSVSSVLGEEIGTCGSKRSSEFDECFARALMIGRNQTLPNNISQVNALCR